MTNTETKAHYEEIDALISILGIEYSATFIPQSVSRNAAEKNPSLNWKVSVFKAGRGGKIETDYMQGIGHAPGYEHGENGHKTAYYKIVAETGKYYANPIPTYPHNGKKDWFQLIDGNYSKTHGNRKPLPAPELRDVLYSLITDSEVLDYAEFEDWAQTFGYDTDSRKAEKDYRACLDTALKLKALIGDHGMERLRISFQDY